jgi:isoleucyl-tRNA synthetase
MTKSFKDTLNLPKTDFSLRANAKAKEPAMLERWQNEKLYEKAGEKNEENGEIFVLHDGPPFANGHMHMGHALNRILKDIVCKVKRMEGYNVVSIPGWDCHGLPIELKVAADHKEDKRTPEGRVSFKKACREYAQKWIDIQKEELQRLGVVTDWDNPYIMMDPKIEAEVLRVFATFVEKGYIERKGKTIPWCATCQTALATAEIEHKDRFDPSCYILFPFANENAKKIFPKVEIKEVGLLVWTTTPWTIPLNRAVMLHPSASYVLLQGRTDDEAFVVGAELADSICEMMDVTKKVLATVDSKTFEGALVGHPYIDGQEAPIIFSDTVMLTDGTACVHSAPGCGPEDYLIGIKHGLEIFSPLSADGKYTEEIKPAELNGMSILDGQKWSIKKMEEVDRLVFKGKMNHSYPHCWRCHEGLMFRATDQWFCDLTKNNIVDRAVEKCDELTFYPEWGKKRLTGSMKSRSEWCLSRQRHWGIPIPALLCNDCEHPHLTADLIRKVAAGVAEEGVEYWDGLSIAQMKEMGMFGDGLVCEKCGNNDIDTFKKEFDILDVWFGSGVSHDAIKALWKEFKLPADLYLEGSDQHRGWFQSSLLNSMIVHDDTCTRAFLTHGFILDEDAQKMSKSKGNVTNPQELVEKYSADIVRLWVASSDFSGDVIVSQAVFRNVAEVYKKIRNTCRFLISNLYDYDYKKDAISVEDMLAVDQYALSRLQEVIASVRVDYEKHSFTSVFQTINTFCTNDLSSFFLDVAKDRLYIEEADGLMRRSAQTAMYEILDALTKLIAPILSYTAEDIADNYQGEGHPSIHLQDFPVEKCICDRAMKKRKFDAEKMFEVAHRVTTIKDATSEVCMSGCWSILFDLRTAVLKAIEGKRASGEIKHSLESSVTFYLDESKEQVCAVQAFIDYIASGESIERFFKDFFIVSQCKIVDSPAGLQPSQVDWLYVDVQRAEGVKCPRCWQWDTEVDEDGLCRRCHDVVNN